MSELKIIGIAIAGALYGIFVIGEERKMGFIVLLGVGLCIWGIIKLKQNYDFTKNNHLDGPHKLLIKCLQSRGEIYAEGTYTSYREGDFSLNRIGKLNSQEDIRIELSESEWSAAQNEIRNYFEAKRK